MKHLHIHRGSLVLTLSCVIVCRGYDGPHDCGNYNSHAWETGFFVSQGGSWDTEYGHFFLSWYSSLLLQHADRVLQAAQAALNKRGRPRKAMRMKEVPINTIISICKVVSTVRKPGSIMPVVNTTWAPT